MSDEIIVDFERRFYKGRTDSSFSNITIQYNGYKMQGDIYKYLGSNTSVVVLPGLGANSEIVSDSIRYFSDRKTCISKFTYSGHYPTGGIFDPDIDLIGANTLLEVMKDECNPEYLFLFGHSYGASLALILARNRKDIDGIILFNPIDSLYEALNRDRMFHYGLMLRKIGFKKSIDKYMKKRGKQVKIEATNMNTQLILDDIEIDLLLDNIGKLPHANDIAKEIYRPVLMFTSEQDRRIPFYGKWELFENLPENDLNRVSIKERSLHNIFYKDEELDIPTIREMRLEAFEFMDMIKAMRSPTFEGLLKGKEAARIEHEYLSLLKSHLDSLSGEYGRTLPPGWLCKDEP